MSNTDSTRPLWFPPNPNSVVGAMPMAPLLPPEERSRRVTFAAVIALLVIGAIIGARLNDIVTSKHLPPVRASFHMDLSNDSFFGAPQMDAYVQGIAGEFQARFQGARRSASWAPDLRVTVDAPSCFESRAGCGPTVRWAFDIRSKYPIDSRVARLAVGPGDLTVRPVIADTGTDCAHQVLGADDAPIRGPIVPLSMDRAGCLSLGPVVHRLVGTSATADTVYSKTLPSSDFLTLAPMDTVWLSDTTRTHPDEDMAILLDGWVIVRVHNRALADLGHPSSVLTTVGVRSPMDGAIATAVNARPPVVEDPARSP